MKLTLKQESAVKTIVERYNHGESMSVISGYAGTGKSTVVKFIIEHLGLPPEKVKYVTFTGKASLVLQRKGLPATTIHKLIYNSFQNPYTGRFYHRLKPTLEEDIRLIVIDEVSMVSKPLLKDLLSFNVPVIALGDSGQLEPIGEDNGLLKSPHVFLDEIHRQAADNSIIRLSMLAREGKSIPVMKDENVIVIEGKDLNFGMMTWADQIICGKNATRRQINSMFRQSLERTTELPVVGDKMICLKNYWDFINKDEMPLINGTIGTVESVLDQSIDDGGILGDKFIMNFTPDYSNNAFEKVSLDTNIIKGNAPQASTYVKGRRPTKPKIEMDYGYAITGHKSQGSEFDKVLAFEEVLRRDSHSRWLYTVITRASEKLILVKEQ